MELEKPRKEGIIERIQHEYGVLRLTTPGLTLNHVFCDYNDITTRLSQKPSFLRGSPARARDEDLV